MESSSPPFHSLYTLSSLNSEQIVALRELSITNLGDLLAYPPFRYARYVRAARDRLLRPEEALGYVDGVLRTKPLDELLESSTEVLRDVGGKQADILKKLGLGTVAELAAFAAIDEAEEIISRAPDDGTDPFAPSCVRPTCKKFSRNTKVYTSFFKEKEIRDLSVYASGGSKISNLFKFGAVENKVIHLGYSVSYLQEWIYLGVHLGEPQGSVNLSMGQDTQVSMLDWRRAMRSQRAEDSRITERLASVLFHQRAVDEVARATAEEHQHGATSAFGANAATAGSFVAAGAVVGGVGGGISGGLVGLSVDALTGGATLGLGTLSGAVVGTAVGSIAGAAAGSIIASGATTLGFIETDAEGDREIFASSGQNIQQRTVQNSSSIRSFWSNIVSQSVEQEQQTVRTDRLTNHNRIHALNAILFEVLSGYRVNIHAQGYAPILFLPFKPFTFNGSILRTYWWLIRTLLVDKNLVKMLDEKYLTLTVVPNPTDQLAELPTIDQIKSSKVTVSINLDSSAIAESIKNAALAAGGAVAAGVVGLGIGAIVGIFRSIFDTEKRDKVKVKLVTSNGTVNLSRENSPNSDPDFIGRFSTDTAVEVASITHVRVINENGEFEILGVDLSKLIFDEVKAKITIKNKADFTGAIPTLGQLVDSQTVSTGEFAVGANSRTDLAWTIGDQLRAKFEGVEALRAQLEAEKLDFANAEQAESMLLDFLNANKFTFTRLILQGIEVEQVISALEDVRIGDIELSEVAFTTPIGFCANHVVLPMKACKIGKAKYDNIGVDTTKLELMLAQYDDLDPKKPAEVVAYLTALRNLLKQFFQSAAASGNGSVRETKVVERAKELLEQVDRILSLVGAGGARRPPSAFPTPAVLLAFDARISTAIRKILGIIQAPITSTSSAAGVLCGHYDSVKASLDKRMGELLSTDEISLPSPAVFMEPVLSNAKGAELYDMRRNSHYALLESPSILAADPNVLRSQPVTLTPTVPGSTLPLLPPPELPLPGNLAAALGEAGKLNLDTLITSNASSLTNILSNLSAMATELAKASATLTGDAQKAALASATDVAKQVGDIVGKTLQAQVQAGATERVAPPPAPTPSPQTQQEKAEVKREAERIDQGDGTPQQKKEKKKTIGAATTPDDPPLVTSALFSFIFNSLRGTELGSLFQLEMRKDGLAITVDGVETQLSRTVPGIQPLDFSESGLSQFPVSFENNGSPVLLTLFGDVQTFGARIDFKKTSAFALPENLSNYLFEIVPENEEIRVTAASKLEAEAALKGEIDFDIEVGGDGASSGGSGGTGGSRGGTAAARKPKLNKNPKLLDKLKNVPSSLPGLFFALAKEIVLPPITATAGASGSAGGSVSGSGSVSVEGTFVFQIPTGDFRIEFLADRSR